MIGTILVLFALVVYPLLGYVFRHIYPSSPTFGLPCPTTIFTLGILLWSDTKIPLFILLIPFFWCIIGFTAAIQLGMREDTALLVAGFITAAILFFQKEKFEPLNKRTKDRRSA